MTENQFGNVEDVEFTPPRVKGPMVKVADELQKMLNPPFGRDHTGFIVMVFPFGEPGGRCNLVTNCKRSDVVPLLQAQIEEYGEKG